MTQLRQLRAVPVALSLLVATACFHGHRPARAIAALQPCAGDTTIYSAGDSAVTPARPKLSLSPPAGMSSTRMTVEGIIEASGNVSRARVVASGGAAADSELVLALRHTAFTPAVRQGCTVRFSLPVTVSVF